MTRAKLKDVGSKQLVKQFQKIALEQYDALLRGEIARFQRLYSQMDDVESELKSRPGDQRRLLVSLYDHPNAQVRLKAAVRTLAVAPEAARQVLEAIASSRKYPQAGDAGMILSGLDRGEFQPT